MHRKESMFYLYFHYASFYSPSSIKSEKKVCFRVSPLLDNRSTLHAKGGLISDYLYQILVHPNIKVKSNKRQSRCSMFFTLVCHNDYARITYDPSLLA